MAGNPNLKPFKPGESGNPGGRRKKPLIVEALEEIGAANDSEKAKQVAARLYSSALKGSVPAAKLIVEYLHGKPKRSEDEKKEGVALTPEQAKARFAELLALPEVRDAVTKLLSGNDASAKVQ